MPAPSPLTNFDASPHPLGQEIQIRWSLPTTLPSTWQIVVLSKAGSNLTAQEVIDYFAGANPDGIFSETISGEEFPDITGYSDLSVTDGIAYYYQGFVQDTGDDAHSDAASDNATPEVTATTSIIDSKPLIITAIERILDNYGMVKDKDYQVSTEYSLKPQDTVSIYVARPSGQILQQFLGHFKQVESNTVIFGETELDNIQVVWETTNGERRDRLTNIFRETKEFIREFLLHPNGGDMDSIEILMAGDVINEAVKDRVQLGGMMMISCVITSSTIMADGLASWLSGEAVGTE